MLQGLPIVILKCSLSWVTSSVSTCTRKGLGWCASKPPTEAVELSLHSYTSCTWQEVQLGAEANQGYSLIRQTSHLCALWTGEVIWLNSCGGWLWWMGVLDGCGGWLWWMAVVDGCVGWLCWMAVVDGCGGWLWWMGVASSAPHKAKTYTHHVGIVPSTTYVWHEEHCTCLPHLHPTLHSHTTCYNVSITSSTSKITFCTFTEEFAWCEYTSCPCTSLHNS